MLKFVKNGSCCHVYWGKSRLKYVVLLFLLLGLSNGTASNVPKVVVSIAPIHSLVVAIMKGVGEPQLLLDSAQSPHTASLKPSQRSMIASADLVIWVGPTLENFLIKPLIDCQRKSCVLSAIEKFPIKKPRYECSHDEGNCDHDIRFVDPHIWLDVAHMDFVINEIVFQLTALDIVHGEIFKQNALKLKDRVHDLHKKYQDTAKGMQKMTYISFHDAYQYLESILPIVNVGVLTAGEGATLSVAQLAELDKLIKDKNVCCLFSEPQFKYPIATKLVASHHLCAGTLDPLGQGLKPGVDLYFVMMENLLKAFTSCPKQEVKK